MPSVRNFNYVDVPSVSVLVQSTVRPLELKQFYPPWTRAYGDRPALGFAYPSPVIPVVVVQQADRLAVQSTIFRTDNIFNTNRFNTPVAVANNSSTKLFISGTVVQPVLASAGYGNGTILTTPIVNKQLFRQNAISDNKTVITNSTVKPNLTSRNSATAKVTVDRFPNIGDFSVVGSYQNSFSTDFDGVGDNLTIAYNAAHHLSGNFTIECWFYARAHGGMILNLAGGLNIAWASYELVSNGDGVNFAASSANNGYDIGSETGAVGRIGVIQLGAWNHLAVTRSGNVYRGFVNGVQGYTQTLSLTPYDPNARGLAIGSNYSGSGGWGVAANVSSSVNGFISNLRIVKGTAVYTANFTPTTQPLTAVAGTSLLTCNTQLIVDQSPNAFTITKFGDVKYSLFQPFPSMAVGSQGHSVTQVKILGVSSFNQTSVPLLTISDSVYSDRFTRQTNDNIGNEATEPVLVYIQDTVINDSNKLKWIITNTVNSGYISKSSVVTVNANKIPDSYVRPILSNAFSITTANKPIALTRHVSSFSNLATIATVFGQSLIESRPLEPITKTITIDSIVATQVRTIITAAQGVTSGLSRSFTLAPYGTAGTLVIGEGGLLVYAQTEFWM